MIVLNTRPEKQAPHLTSLIEKNGGTVFYFPLITINPIEFYPVNPALFDYFIFTSANAVAHFFESITVDDFSHAALIAVGPATKHALEKKGLLQTDCPDEFSSEGLLKMPALKNVADKKIAIVCGENPKLLLQHELIERHATVNVICCYQRESIHYDMDSTFLSLQKANIETIIVTSAESFSHLLALFEDPAHFDWLIHRTLCVVTLAMEETARSLGFRSVVVAENATDEAIVKVIGL